MLRRSLLWLPLAALWLLLGVAAPQARAEGDVCWRDSYGRGVGTVPGECEMHQDKSGLLCYPKCKPGYTGVAFVCWEDCPPGFTDTGGHCLKPKPYGRGAGYPWKFGDTAFSLDDARARCQKDHGRGNCEKSGEIIYPKCKSGFHNVGCCICSPDCPPGMTDIGVSCQKRSYTRSTHLPDCDSGMENDAGLCYKKCKPGYNGVGPVCWGTCPADKPVNCGAACAKSSADCALAVTDQVVSVTDIVSSIALTVVTGGAGGAAKQAATKGAKTAVKLGTKAAVRASAKQSMKQTAKKLGKTSKAQIKKSLQAMRSQAKAKGKKEANDLSDDDIEKMAEALDNARTAAELGTDPPMDILEVMELVDPTGIMAVVNAYNKPICSAPEAPAPTRMVAVTPPSPGASTSCAGAIQGKIAWDYQGNKGWAQPNIDRLCKGGAGSAPAACFDRVMQRSRSLFGQPAWTWQTAIDLCEGSKDAADTVLCYEAEAAAGKSRAAAIAACDERAQSVCAGAVQGKIAWSKGGSTQWNPANVTALCGTVPGVQPARCFEGLIQGTAPAKRKDGQPWQWGDAIQLCGGAQDAGLTHACFSAAIRRGLSDAAAIAECRRK